MSDNYNTYKIQAWGEEYKVRAIKAKYTTNGNLAIQLICEDEEYGGWEPYGGLTVNLNKKLPPNQAFVDVNNIPNAESFIEENGLGKSIGDFGLSGFCIYPIYEFDLEKLEES